MEAPEFERKLVAVLAADVVGYSRLMQEDEEATLATLSAHRRIIDGLIAANRGHICNTAGDSILAEFVSVVDAVNCAVAIQQALAAANADHSPERQMHLRIGINLGDVVVQEGDIFGVNVNVAARLEALAPPQGICVTRSVRDQLRDRSDCEFQDLGEHELKNIARPVRVFCVLFGQEGTLPSHSSDEGRALSEAPQPTREDSEAAEVVFWQSVQASGKVDEYETYLSRFPNGIFAELAQSRLSKMPVLPPELVVDRTVELAFWNSVQGSDDGAMYEAYLDKYPEGEFKALAELRLLLLNQRSSPLACLQPRPFLIRAA